MQPVLTPDLILKAYQNGLFPMAYSADSPHINWICPDQRGQLSITDMHIPRSLLKRVKQQTYEVRIDTAFDQVITACAEDAPDRPETWINDSIKDVFGQLHQMGHAHSVECWHDGELLGGLYGLKIGGAFFGESMFSRATDASKVALVHLTARLWAGGFKMLDTQFVNDHLEQFGVYEIDHADYMTELTNILAVQADFTLKNTLESDILSNYLAMRRNSR